MMQLKGHILKELSQDAWVGFVNCLFERRHRQARRSSLRSVGTEQSLLGCSSQPEGIQMMQLEGIRLTEFGQDAWVGFVKCPFERRHRQARRSLLRSVETEQSLLG